ncbi:MFS transporter [Ruminiclostridium cellulolyticum]|uniref:Drug resistance transporter, EmrB/QacA subfamily n=1 Tax=Ruminiclostridium cellulolyticum (strain ATCC 35319 / DSM 5812 / JCM 6584 / H10) TaxID=394503 RepID=B8I645_RUMCH|nr:MFS transporter [Ruminiclostridium cellulolyticum]ACL76810.1 drug resistance transporter, EmrB/QacA subfamily [Ruminiclostridium cellulolyticum H10]
MENTEKQYKNKGLILLNIVLLTFMSCLDSSIVNVALPVMANEFSVGMGSISTIVSTYLIAISATVLIFGRLGDIKGKVKIFKTGIVVFTFGSLLCAVSRTLNILVISRIIQAIGAASFMATNQGIITRTFPANERGRALGITGSFVALGTLAGPPLGGFIVDVASWEYIFLINIPIGIFAFIMGIKVLPKDEEVTDTKFDIKGAILFLISIISLFSALLAGEQIGFLKPVILLSFGVAAISFILFIRIEGRVESPLLQLSIFRNKLFSLSIFCGFLLFVCMSCSNIILPFYFQDIIKMTPWLTGIYLISYPLILLVVSPVSGYLSDKTGSETLTFVGLSIFSIGCFLMATINQTFNPIKIILFISLMAVGNGMFQSPNNALVMSTVPRSRLGIAGSINALVRNLGLVIGVSVSTLVLYGMMSFKVGYKVTNFVEGKEAEFIFGMSSAYIFIGALSLIAAILTAVRLYRTKKNAASNDNNSDVQDYDFRDVETK